MHVPSALLCDGVAPRCTNPTPSKHYQGPTNTKQMGKKVTLKYSPHDRSSTDRDGDEYAVVRCWKGDREKMGW
jgi:hypothetical protein